MSSARVNDKRFLWKYFNLLIPTWQHRVDFKEIVIIGTLLMQLRVSEGQAKRAGAMLYYPITVSPF